MSGPNKGPQGKSDYGQDSYYMPEPQERYEEEGEKDVVRDIPSHGPIRASSSRNRSHA